MKGLLGLLNKSARAAGRTAVAFLQSQNPEFRVHNASLRAEEDERFVFAVFYTTPDLMVKPTPYRLIVVGRDGHAEEIDPPRESEYWIRGRK